VTGINFRPTATNAPSMRQEATRGALTRLVEGEAGLLIDPRCKQLRKGFNSGYRYRKMKVGGATGRFDTKPEKNSYSHLNEAAEYLLLGGGHGIAGVMGRTLDRLRQSAQADATYDIFGDAA
jgi:hypothetical protein